MASAPKRYSSYSVASNGQSRSNIQYTQISTQTLLTSLHTSYQTAQLHVLDAGTSLVVNTWITAATEGSDGRQGGTVDVELARRAWEHARRRAEDSCIVLGSLHESTPPLLAPFISALPLDIPSTFNAALTAIQPFLHCVTPQNHSYSRASSLAATFSISNTGSLTEAVIKLSNSGIDTVRGLINIPAESGFRAFDAFYYLLSSASSASERDALGLRSPSSYSLLGRSETYGPPSFLPTADDSASAEDFRAALKTIGITGSKRRDLLSSLAALLKIGETLGFLLDEDELDEVCEDAAGLLGIDPEILLTKCNSNEREILIGGLYEAIVDWVIAKANEAIAEELIQSRNEASTPSGSRPGAMTPTTSNENDEIASITVVEVPSSELGKAASLKTVFDDSEGINAEMREDGISFPPAGHSVLTEMKGAINAWEPELGIHSGHAGRERELEHDRREGVLDKVGQECDEDSFLRNVIFPVPGQGICLGQHGRFDLSTTMGSSRVWFHLSLHPTDASPASLSPNSPAWSAGSVSRQLRAWRLPEWANRRNRQLDFTADYDMEEFSARFSRLGCKDGKDGIESFILERGWSNGEVVVGKERVWIREGAWWEAESMLEMLPTEDPRTTAHPSMMGGGEYQNYNDNQSGYNQSEYNQSGFYKSPFGDSASIISGQPPIQRNDSMATFNAPRSQLAASQFGASQLGGKSIAPTTAPTHKSMAGGDYGLGSKGDAKTGAISYEDEMDPELGDAKNVKEQPISRGRKAWINLVWALTFWIPSPFLRFIGRMKRPDVRMAWREKLVLCLIIFFLNAIVIFYIVFFGHILCPNYDKAWNKEQLSFHQGGDDFYVAVRGKVYDISNFWQLDHGSAKAQPVEPSLMQPLAGDICDPMFPIPLVLGCPGLVSDKSLELLVNASDPRYGAVVTNSFQHKYGPDAVYTESKLDDNNWYDDTFLKKMKHYYKGELVVSSDVLKSVGQEQQRPWFQLNGNIYDLSQYFFNVKQRQGYKPAKFLPEQLTFAAETKPGQDISDDFNKWAKNNASAAHDTIQCLNNVFYAGKPDFRDSPKCQVNNYILLAFTVIICTVIATKFLSALQLGSKRRPAAQDKFVICQVPAYTEGEDHLRKGLDSLTAMAYDNKRKLICVICDGMIVGGGNDRPTPKIVLDILGVDPKIDPPALPFRSVGVGSEQLNYGKVYSGLYEYEGNVVPYIVVVKVGKESEQRKSKPGNRGKRDSQIMLMSFLNRVHHRSPMSPLELEMFHQINNIIGVDPELYEYLFMVDADTMVKEDALNRLVAGCANDAKIAGICGETSLQNEERSWWTMIQVYEYYISHHLAKAFESLFGSVTCLPGCFCMYRLRTADRGKPLIVSDKVIKDYAINDVDTLHKKNLLSLGEDRYLTTLMTKHFPHMSYKFVNSALAYTAAPDEFSVLLSQRRRWINSTIHNLVELFFLKDLCGFCCFSMRFVVFMDLFGTLILPATCIYLAYLIYRIATGTGQFPLVSIVLIGCVYGLQAIIFIIKRQWQHIGWMIIYLLAYPIYSFALPIYSFWKQDDFSWGNTRVVVGEKGNKQVVVEHDEGFDPRSIPLQRWDDYALANNLPGRRGPIGGVESEKNYGVYDDGYEMDDIRSVYSSAKPASTVLSGFKSQGAGVYMPPQSPAQYPQVPRQSNYTDFTRYTDTPMQQQQQQQQSQSRLMSMGNMSEQAFQQQQQMMHQPGVSPYIGSRSPAPFQSTDNLMGSPSPPINRNTSRSPFQPQFSSRAQSTVPDFQNSMSGHGQPSDNIIVEQIKAVLSSVDLDTVTKKQVRVLVETRLQCSLSPVKKEFLDNMIDVELANM